MQKRVHICSQILSKITTINKQKYHHRITKLSCKEKNSIIKKKKKERYYLLKRYVCEKYKNGNKKLTINNNKKFLKI